MANAERLLFLAIRCYAFCIRAVGMINETVKAASARNGSPMPSPFGMTSFQTPVERTACATVSAMIEFVRLPQGVTVT